MPMRSHPLTLASPEEGEDSVLETSRVSGSFSYCFHFPFCISLDGRVFRDGVVERKAGGSVVMGGRTQGESSLRNQQPIRQSNKTEKQHVHAG